jgi:hypothetical protein
LDSLAQGLRYPFTLILAAELIATALNNTFEANSAET